MPFVLKWSFRYYIALIEREIVWQYKPILQKSTLTLLLRRRPWWLFWSCSFRSKWVTSCQRNPLCYGEFRWKATIRLIPLFFHSASLCTARLVTTIAKLERKKLRTSSAWNKGTEHIPLPVTLTGGKQHYRFVWFTPECWWSCPACLHVSFSSQRQLITHIESDLPTSWKPGLI